MPFFEIIIKTYYNFEKRDLLSKILIFAGAKEAKLLIEKIANNYLNLGEFHIIYEDDEIKEGFEKENLFFYKINFYAFENYKNIIKKDFDKIIIFIKNQKTAEFVLKHIKLYKTSIVFVKFWYEYKLPPINNIEIIDVADIITNKVIDLLPGVPLFARNIGLGQGEILEVEIPPHSPFIYKTPSIFKNYNVRMATLYRNGELKENPKIILPNDKIILIGRPERLKEIFHRIKNSIGAFPQPYGQNIYLLLDMKKFNQKEISKFLKTALFLHRKLKNKLLIIKIINPTTKHRIYKLFKFPDISIITDYNETSYIKALKKDINKFNIGLTIIPNEIFLSYKKEFFEIRKPILKVGKESIKKCQAIGAIVNKYTPNIASILYDLSHQLGIGIKFFEIDPENNSKEIVSILKEINFLKTAKVEFISIKNQNPITYLNSLKNICLAEAFAKIPPSKLKMILHPKIEFSYILIDKNQFLIPIKDEE